MRETQQPPRAKPSQRANTKSPAPESQRRTDAAESEMLAPVVPRVPGVMSEPRRGRERELGEPPSSQPLRRAVSSVSTDTEEVRRLRTQLQAMKEQVHFMHRVMQGLSPPEKDLLKGKHLPNKRLSFDGISPVKKTRGSSEVLVMPEEAIPFLEKWRRAVAHDQSSSFLDEPEASISTYDEPELASPRERELQSKVDALQAQNDALKAQLHRHKQATIASEADLLAQVEDLSAKLSVIDAENIQLRSHIEEFEEENIRLHGELAQINKVQEISLESNNQGDTTGDSPHDPEEELHDELGIDGLGEQPDDVHERCEAKIHELWQTIKTLKAYVETFRVENEDLRVQRDNAIESAERAWEENVKLAGNNNPQQKIKYVEVLKQENASLIEQVRVLQSKLTKKKFKNKGEKGGKGSSDSGSEPLEEYPSLDSGDEHSDDGSYEERTKLLKKMWARNKKLEEEIDRLQKEKQALVMRQPRTPSVDSRQSKPSSKRSTTVSNSSTRWRK